MNYVDFTILLIAVIGFLYGLIKGVIRQVGSLGGFIAGMVVARFFGGSFSALLREMFDLPEGVSRVIVPYRLHYMRSTDEADTSHYASCGIGVAR